MGRSSSQQAAAASTAGTDELPSFDGSQLAIAQWLRDLEGYQHLFDADVAYFLVTGAAVTSQGKAAILSPEHSKLLEQGNVQSANYSVLNPPPVEDCFRDAYKAIRDGIANQTIVGLNAADYPSPAPDPPDHHIVAPDRLMQTDMKLRNNILALITSTGRRRHYQQLTHSGCALLRLLALDAKSSVSDYVESPHIRRLKAMLNEVRKVRMTKISMQEFNEIRDSVDEINDQLFGGNQMTPIQLCDHYLLSLIHI